METGHATHDRLSSGGPVAGFAGLPRRERLRIGSFRTPESPVLPVAGSGLVRLTRIAAGLIAGSSSRLRTQQESCASWPAYAGKVPLAPLTARAPECASTEARWSRRVGCTDRVASRSAWSTASLAGASRMQSRGTAMPHPRASGRSPTQFTLRPAVVESNQPRPDGEAVLARMSELLFVEVLRRHIDAFPAEQTGWLAGRRRGPRSFVSPTGLANGIPGGEGLFTGRAPPRAAGAADPAPRAAALPESPRRDAPSRPQARSRDRAPRTGSLPRRPRERRP